MRVKRVKQERTLRLFFFFPYPFSLTWVSPNPQSSEYPKPSFTSKSLQYGWPMLSAGRRELAPLEFVELLTYKVELFYGVKWSRVSLRAGRKRELGLRAGPKCPGRP